MRAKVARQAGSFLSSIVFGYMVRAFHGYDRPLVPMALALFLAASLWSKIDPAKPLIAEAQCRQRRRARAKRDS